MDELQAAILSVKLKNLDAENRRRQELAHYYNRTISNPLVTVPTSEEGVWHIYPVLCSHRDALQQFVLQHGVETLIHYPLPVHKQRCYNYWHDICMPITESICAQELSLPCHQAMTDGEAERVADIVNSFTL